MNEKYTINIYDFDPADLTPSDFDVSNCFRGKEKFQFAIQFSYPKNYSNIISYTSLKTKKILHIIIILFSIDNIIVYLFKLNKSLRVLCNWRDRSINTSTKRPSID